MCHQTGCALNLQTIFILYLHCVAALVGSISCELVYGEVRNLTVRAELLVVTAVAKCVARFRFDDACCVWVH